MNFNFTFHDNGGRVVKKFCCEADCYDEAYEKANKAACEIPASGIQYCDAKWRPEGIYHLPHIVSYLKPRANMLRSLPTGWQVVNSNFCVERYGDSGVLVKNSENRYAICDGRKLERVNPKFANWVEKRFGNTAIKRR